MSIPNTRYTYDNKRPDRCPAAYYHIITLILFVNALFAGLYPLAVLYLDHNKIRLLGSIVVG